GRDLLLTGYIDRIVPSIDAGSHSLTASGRGRCQDLVDCAANFEGGQINNRKVDDIATLLAFQFAIGIEIDGDPGPAISQINIANGETPFEIIERICRFRQLIVYELPNGNLKLQREFKTAAASGFVQGVNVLRA